ncbi:DUF7666 domain-containing protein [Enterocloster bolteae]|uniref:DUF7666 domain-containing protein n=1 Tax=Enterocloster bolteae TaxID=208479 RepID=UPI004068F30B
MEEIIKSYKGFNKDMTCKNKQYEVGKDYEEDKAVACECGMHACEYPLDCFKYYPPSKSVYCEVEQSGDISRHDDSKIASTKMRIGAQLNIAGIVNAAIKYTKEKVEKTCIESKSATAGDYGAATAGDYGAATAGDYGAATAGYCGAATARDYGAATAGDYGAATAGDSGAATAGDYGAATAGDYGAATAGDCGAATAGDSGAATAGDRGAATSRGKSSTGENGLSVARGKGVKAKGGLGSILVIAEEEQNSCKISSWKAVVVDGVNIKADTWYTFKDGELIEAED